MRGRALRRRCGAALRRRGFTSAVRAPASPSPSNAPARRSTDPAAAQGELRAPDGGALCRLRRTGQRVRGPRPGASRLHLAQPASRPAPRRPLGPRRSGVDILPLSLCIDAHLQALERPSTAFQLNDASRCWTPSRNRSRPPIGSRIDQASSGGEQWASRNHVDPPGRVSLCRSAAAASVGGCERVDIATASRPACVVAGRGRSASATRTSASGQQFSSRSRMPTGCASGVPRRRRRRSVRAAGGERSTHTLFFQLAPAARGRSDGLRLGARPVGTGVCRRVTSEASAPFRHYRSGLPAILHTDYLRLDPEASEGSSLVLRQAWAIDSTAGATSATPGPITKTASPPASIRSSRTTTTSTTRCSGFSRLARSADPRWFELAADAGAPRHRYRPVPHRRTTSRPTAAASSGTPRTTRTPAAPRTRSYSADTSRRSAGSFGGGPSCENNFTPAVCCASTVFTGDPRARDAVLQNSPIGCCAWTTVDAVCSARSIPVRAAWRAIRGPSPTTGRAAARGTPDQRAARRALADRRIGARISPRARSADCALHPSARRSRRGSRSTIRRSRWSYTVFPQALGRLSRPQARVWAASTPASRPTRARSLVRYADWMLERTRARS